jgi:transposase
MNNSFYYVGLDVHKKKIAYCVKTKGGRIISTGSIEANPRALSAWATGVSRQWMGALEATLFTGWIYDFLTPYAYRLKVAHPHMLRAIVASKKKSDRIDAEKIADLVRCDLLPECYMAPRQIRELRRILRYRNLLVREATRFKNKTAGLLMEVGVSYSKTRLHRKKYFSSLLESLTDIPDSVVELLRLSRSSMEVFQMSQKRLLRALRDHPQLRTRVERLMSIRGVGEVTALTWALEVGDPNRFGSIRQAVSYCGLSSAQQESAGKSSRGAISKQRNKHLQWTLVEAAKLAPHFNPQLAELYARELRQGNRNRATLAVARKLVAYLLAVDKSQKEFEPREGAA